MLDERALDHVAGLQPAAAGAVVAAGHRGRRAGGVGVARLRARGLVSAPSRSSRRVQLKRTAMGRQPCPSGRSIREAAHTLLVQSSKSVTLFHMTELAEHAQQLPTRCRWARSRWSGATSATTGCISSARGPRCCRTCSPSSGQGVLDHSVFFADTAARVKRSLPPIFMTVYGSDDDNRGHPGPRLPPRHQGRHAQ